MLTIDEVISVVENENKNKNKRQVLETNLKICVYTYIYILLSLIIGLIWNFTALKIILGQSNVTS